MFTCKPSYSPDRNKGRKRWIRRQRVTNNGITFKTQPIGVLTGPFNQSICSGKRCIKNVALSCSKKVNTLDSSLTISNHLGKHSPLQLDTCQERPFCCNPTQGTNRASALVPERYITPIHNIIRIIFPHKIPLQILHK